MGGLVAFVGENNCASVLVEALRRLEYRRYDAGGLAVQTGRGIEIVRAMGNVTSLADALSRTSLRGAAGIGHTRWAALHARTERNASPQTSGPVAVVYDGKVENNAALRRELELRGRRFATNTDTEIVAHLVAEALHDGAGTVASAMRIALARVRGPHTIAAISNEEPDTIVVAKNESLLIVGTSDDGSATLAASDVPAIVGLARKVVFLQDGEIAILRRDRLEIHSVDGEVVVEREPRRVDWSIPPSETGRFTHVIEREIHEQPRAVEQTIREQVDRGQAEVGFEDIGLHHETATKISRVCFVGCGSSAHAAMVARHWIEDLARLPCTVSIAGESGDRQPQYGSDDLVIAVSQSGENADTLAALKNAREAGARVLAVSNVHGSAIARAADGALYTHAGPQLATVSTKGFTTQLAVLLLFAVWLGRRREALSNERSRAILAALHRVPAQMKELVGESHRVREIANTLVADMRSVLFFGRAIQEPIAREGALALKAIGLVDAEAYAASAMTLTTPVIVACPKDAHRESTLSELQEVMPRGARLIVIATHGDTEAAVLSEATIFLPEADEAVLPLLTAVPMQLLAFHCLRASHFHVP